MHVSTHSAVAQTGVVKPRARWRAHRAPDSRSRFDGSRLTAQSIVEALVPWRRGDRTNPHDVRTDGGRSEHRDDGPAGGGVADVTDALHFVGRVTTGLGKGEEFVRLEGYRRQFRDRLGYDPYPGTLNVSLTATSAADVTALADYSHVSIDGWEDGDRSFGPVRCYPATVRTEHGDRYQQVHLIVPERSEHDEDELELLADCRLRERLDLADGDRLITAVETA